MFRKKFTKRAYKKRGFKRAAKPKARMTKSVRRAVVAVVNRQIETKQYSYSGNFDLCSYTANNSTNNFFPLSPTDPAPGIVISQGTGEGQRIGNKIRVVKAVMKYVIYPTAQSGTNNITPEPIDVIIRLFSSKRTPTTLLTSVPGYFDLGSTVITPTGLLADINRPVNNDAYTEYTKRIHKIGFADYSGTGINVGSQSFTNNDYKLNAIGTLDYTKYLPKVIKFDDNLGQTANSRMLQTFCEAVNANGTAQVSLDLVATMQYTITLWYKDA